MSHVIRFGIDLAKHTFAICGVDEHAHTIVKKTLTRKQLLPFFANAPSAMIATMDDSLPHGWASCLASTPPAANRGWAASPSDVYRQTP